MSLPLRKRFPRLVIPLEDALRYSPLVHRAAARLLALKASFKSARSAPAARLQALTQAYQAAWDGPLLSWIRKLLAPAMPPAQPSLYGEEPWSRLKVGWSRYQRPGEPTRITRSVILKAPDERTGERGVLLMTFEYNWLRLLSGVDMRDFAQRFNLVFSTSWSPTDYNILSLALEKIPDSEPVFVQACNYSEISKLNAFHPRIRSLGTLPCDWLNPAFYEPLPTGERPYDILMLSNWAPFKRHWQFFQALAHMRKDLRIALIGQKESGYTQEDIRKLARSFGAKQDFTIFESIPPDEVTRLQCSARTSVIFSRREGCCVAAVESLMAGSPLALLHDAHVGPRAYINEKTGVLLRPGQIAEQLSRFVEEAGNYTPREWATEKISCHSSIHQLNGLLRTAAQEAGRPWTHDLLMPCWRPHPTIMHNPAHGVLRPVYTELHRRYPDVFAPDLMEISHR